MYMCVLLMLGWLLTRSGTRLAAVLMSTSTSILDLLVLWIASFSHNKAPFFLEVIVF